MNPLNELKEVGKRTVKNYTDCLMRIEEIWQRLNSNQEDYLNRIAEVWRRIDDNQKDLSKRMEEVWERIDHLEHSYNDSGFQNLKGRLDVRLIRLEILAYYSIQENYINLSESEKELIRALQNKFDYDYAINRQFGEDELFPDKTGTGMSFKGQEEIFQPLVPAVQADDNGSFIIAYGHKIYLKGKKSEAEGYAQSLYGTIEAPDSPHTYLRPQDDGVDIIDGDIICDVGAAEGFFGMKYLEKARKVYFFETDPSWLEMLEKTCAPYKDKCEIVKGFVGIGEGCIKLDEFFRDKEKPTVIKMDVEGAESVVLASAEKIREMAGRLLLLVCTYHRQDDWNNIYSMLHPTFKITSSNGFYWHMNNMKSPFLRKAVMRALKE